MITIHVRRGDPVPMPEVLKHLHGLADGDRSRYRVTSRGVEVDDALAAAYLTQRPDVTALPAATAPTNLADVVRNAEARGGLAGDGSPRPRKKTSRGVQP